MPSEKTDKEVIATYQAIAKLYGEENAAKMVGLSGSFHLLADCSTDLSNLREGEG